MLNDWTFKRYDNFEVQPKNAIKKNKFLSIVNEVVCLDTETAWNHDIENPIAWVYQWSFSFQKQLVYGRNPYQLMQALETLKEKLELSEERKLKIFIHNSAYDIQYIKNFLIQYFGENVKILAIQPHKFISFEIDSFIFLCSYILTNKSLAKLSKDLKVKHKKLSGLIDYDIIRNQQDKLFKNDWKYLFYDVVTLHECIEKLMILENDNIATIPLTSTGYVRRDCRKKAKENKKHHKFFKNTALNEETYIACKQAFSGGLTHGNRFYSGVTVHGNIKHYDFVSHYPTQQRCKKFPMSKFNLLGENLYFSEIKPYLKDNILLLKIVFENIELKDKKITLPYLQESKVNICKSFGSKIIADNGRVLKMTGITEIWLSDLDLEIILSQYKFTGYLITKCYIATADYLPKWFTEIIDKYFKEKSDFKYLEKNCEDLEKKADYSLSLMKSKNRLNGIYGMSATDIVRDFIIMDLESGLWSKKRPENISETLEKYYDSRNNFLPFQWGYMTTSYARSELVHVIRDIIGYENFLYCDTDSCFYVDDENNTIEKKIEELNKKWLKENEEKGFYIISNNKKVNYHQFDNENEKIISFRFLHSKCYAYEFINKKGEKELKCVIAGVVAKKGKVTREKELGSIDNLKSGKQFIKCGGTRAIYTESEIFEYNGNICSSACIIVPDTKTLSNDIESILESYDYK